MDVVAGGQVGVQSTIEWLRSVDVSASSPEALFSLRDEVRRLQRSAEAVLVRISQRASELDDRVGSAQEAMLGTGEVSGRAAEREAARGAAVSLVPEMGDALARGDVSGEHLDALARAAKGLDEQQTAVLQALGADLASRGSGQAVDTFARHVRKVVDGIRKDHGQSRFDSKRRRSAVRTWEGRRGDSMGGVRADLDDEWFAIVSNALEEETARLAAQDGATVSDHLRALALVEICRRSSGSGGSLKRPAITVIPDEKTMREGFHDQTVCETATGAPIPPATLARICCDADVTRLVLDEAGVPLHLGRNRRTATVGQWKALTGIYSSCAWSGCDRPITWCHAHHIQHWEHGGRTDLPNLVPLCNQHHHRVHEGRWNLRLLGDRTLEILRPDGTLWATTQPDRLDGGTSDGAEPGSSPPGDTTGDGTRPPRDTTGSGQATGPPPDQTGNGTRPPSGRGRPCDN